MRSRLLPATTAIIIVALVAFGFTGHVEAWERNQDGTPAAQWPTPQFAFRINSSNFVSLIPGIPLSEGEWRAWIFYALSRWNVSTGLDWDPVYQGTSTQNGCTQFPDGENTIDATINCVDAACMTLAIVRRYRSDLDLTQILEADLCVIAPAPLTSWGITDGEINAGAIDIVGVLVHEFGHFLDLGHTLNTVMHPDLAAGRMDYRLPTWDDIEGARAVFPGTVTLDRARRWRRRDGSNSWSDETKIPSSNQWIEPTGSIGWSSVNGDVVVVGGLGDSGFPVHLTRTAYPLDSGVSGTTGLGRRRLGGGRPLRAQDIGASSGLQPLRTPLS